MPGRHADLFDAFLRGRPELKALAEGVTFEVVGLPDAPFRVPGGTFIEVARGAICSRATLPIHVRHALEIAMWHRVLPCPRSPAMELASCALALLTTLRYADAIAPAEQSAALDALPRWFRNLHRLTHEYDRAGDGASIAADLVSSGARLLRLQGAMLPPRVLTDEAVGDARTVVAELMPLAMPTERLLTAGGDSRLILDAASRLNKYGCSPVPRPWTAALSSCTASSPSEPGYCAAERARQQLIATAASEGTHSAFAAAMEELRCELATVIGLDRIDGAEIVLSASGTDCELYALLFALDRQDQRVVSIVIGPEEIGGGSPAAAAGRYFDAVAPLVSRVPVGQPVEGFDLDRLRVESIPVRDSSGAPVAIADLDATVDRIVRNAVRQGEHVLLHVVDGSKTGLRAPSIRAVRELHREFGDRLTVLVDAAQMRTRSSALAKYVDAGWLVMVSGSKFFMGPPFSGALLVPRALAARARDLKTIPAGLAAYSSTFDVPSSWETCRASLPSTPNVGLLARWRAALAEMRAFYAIDDESHDARFGALCRQIRSRLLARRCVELVSAPVGDRDDFDEGWDTRPTIFTFVLKPGQGTRLDDRVLGYDDAWQVYVWLNRDLGAMLPADASADDRRLAAWRCHIGQPVKLKWINGQVAGALRLALGARSSLEAVREAERVLDKIDVILRHWPRLNARPAVA